MLGEQIGKGAFSVVHAARSIMADGTLTGAPVAVKIIKADEDAAEAARQEAKLLRALKGHHAVVSLLDVVDADALWLVLELGEPSPPPMCATECGIFSNGADKYKGDSLCVRNEPEYKGGKEVYRCRPPTAYPAPYCAAGYSLCQTARACKEKKKCARKIGNCAKKVRKAPGKWHKCLKKWGKGADGVCTSKKAKRKCPASCGMPGC